jgi:hypothetical protein
LVNLLEHSPRLTVDKELEARRAANTIRSHDATIPNCCFLNDREADVAIVADAEVSAHVGKEPIPDDNKQGELVILLHHG